MSGSCRVCLLALPILATAAPPSRADVFIRTPFVTVIAGQPPPPGGPQIRVQVSPWLDLQVRPASSVPGPRPIRPILPEPALADPAPALLGEERPWMLRDFARTFQPASGFYEVVFVHPATRTPVVAHFTLPEGQPRKVRVFPRQLVFDYGKERVRIVFEPRGKVRVDYR